MSTYVLMRLLESAPYRYDLGIRLLTFGRLEDSYNRLTSRIEPGQRVIDLGCGTGALALRAARRGAKVKGIDVNAQMLEIAEQRALEADLTGTVSFTEMGVAELDSEAAESYDAVTSGLAFSELSENELIYTLRQVMRILRPGGLLLVADEVKPRNLFIRLLHALIRVPLKVLTYVLTQETSRAIAGLPRKVTEAGFSIISIRLSDLFGFCEIVAQKPAEPLR